MSLCVNCVVDPLKQGKCLTFLLGLGPFFRVDDTCLSCYNGPSVILLYVVWLYNGWKTAILTLNIKE